MDYRHWMDDEAEDGTKPVSHIPSVSVPLIVTTPLVITPAPTFSRVQRQILKHSAQSMMTMKLIAVGVLLFIAALFKLLELAHVHTGSALPVVAANQCPACVEAVPLKADAP